LTFTITSPGIYTDVPTADYFADPTPSPSLTQSIAKVLIERSPAHAWIEHPRLNPKWEPADPTKYDIGNIAHALLLGRGKALQVIEGFDDWRKKDAQEAREIAQAEGKLGVLAKHYEIGREMAAAAGKQLAERGFEWDWADGDAEAVIVAEQSGLWYRAMVDWLAKDRRRVWDLKTTAASASPYSLDWRLVEQGWDVQAAMHERILDAIDPDNAGRREHLFVVQENFEPYALTVVRLPESVLTMGRKKLHYAIVLWSTCMAANEWPAYPLETVLPSYPGAAETRWLSREVEESERKPRPPINILSAG